MVQFYSLADLSALICFHTVIYANVIPWKCDFFLSFQFFQLNCSENYAWLKSFISPSDLKNATCCKENSFRCCSLKPPLSSASNSLAPLTLSYFLSLFPSFLPASILMLHLPPYNPSKVCRVFWMCANNVEPATQHGAAGGGVGLRSALQVFVSFSHPRTRLPASLLFLFNLLVSLHTRARTWMCM